MYNPQEIAKRIKEIAQQKNIRIKELLELSGIKNINAISELSKGQQMSYISLGNIADVLEVSVDYLLGRTSNPNINIKLTETEQLDEMIAELVKSFKLLEFSEKMEIMNTIIEKTKK